MHRNWKFAAAGVAALAVAGAGGAFAATKLMSPGERSQAIITDAANQLGVQPQALTNALKKALENQVDAEVAAGRITKEQGDALKQRIEDGAFPILGLGGRHDFRFGFAPGGHGLVFGTGLDAAAKYLGVTEAALRTELENGKTLAQVAKDKGKSVDGLVGALTADAKSKLDEQVAEGDLTRAEADAMLARMKEHVQAFVNGTLPKRPFFHHERDSELPAQLPLPTA